MRSHLATAALVFVLSFAPAANAAAYWSGWYVGLNAGYLWSNSNAVNTESVPGPCAPATGGGCTLSPNYSTLFAIGATGSAPSEFDGFTGGGQIGYNWLVSNWMWGLEADIQAATSTDVTGSYTVVTPSPNFPAQPATTTFTATRGLDYLATLRARIGVLISPQTLAYATGGFAFGGADLGASYFQDCIGCIWLNAPVSGFDMRDTLVGFTIGGGLEFALGEHWSLKTEYLYYDLGEMALPQQVVGTTALGTFAYHSPVAQADYDGHVVRVGVNFRF